MSVRPALEHAQLVHQFGVMVGPAYEYEAPTAGYSGLLEFSRQGVVANYPGLFVLVSM